MDLDQVLEGLSSDAAGLDAAGRIELARGAADGLRRMIATIEAGEITASANVLAGLRGAALALSALVV